MKKLISILMLSCLCSAASADDMKFITVLSSPVGTFNRLEAVDPATPAKGQTVNFCTKVGTSGTVELKGNKPALLNKIALASGTTLGRSGDGKFSLANITLSGDGSLTGARLFGDKLSVKNQTVGTGENIYGNTLTVVGAKTLGLNVGNGDSVMVGTGSTTKGMVWSNEYQRDDACKDGSSYTKCTQQYLLKEKGKVQTAQCPATPGDPRTYWSEARQACGCPGEDEVYHNGACCSGSTKDDPRCWSDKCWVGYYDPGWVTVQSLSDSIFCRHEEDGSLPNLTVPPSPIKPDDAVWANVKWGKNGTPCTTLGEKALTSCGYIDFGDEGYKISGIFGECRTSSCKLYDKDSGTDTRFSCGH